MYNIVVDMGEPSKLGTYPFCLLISKRLRDKHEKARARECVILRMINYRKKSTGFLIRHSFINWVSPSFEQQQCFRF